MVDFEHIEWAEFNIAGEEGLFELTSSSSEIDKKNLNTDKDQEFNTPYVTRTEKNNGINLFVADKQSEKFVINEGNVITIGLDTQTVFYQPYPFYTGQNIHVLKHSQLNKDNALFILPLLKSQMDKFNWGGNGATLTRLERTKIMFPIDESDNPNWEFMEGYVKQLSTRKKINYRISIEKRLAEISYEEIPILEEKEWGEFFLTDIFDTIQRGKRLTKKNQIPGSTPYVSSSALDNGVSNYISNEENVRSFSHCLTIANSGSVGATFYHPYEFVASDHVTHLKSSGMNKYVYLFIATMVNRIEDKYSFNREINDKRIKREKVMLPLNEYGEINFEYMEQCTMNIMFLKYKQYLEQNY